MGILLSMTDLYSELIPEGQHGFMHGKSCITQMFITEALEKQCITLNRLYIDIKNSYDNVDRNILLKTLEELGI